MEIIFGTIVLVFAFTWSWYSILEKVSQKTRHGLKFVLYYKYELIYAT